MTSLTYSVPGITCDHCRQAIESELATVPGAQRVEVRVADKTVTVEGTADDVSIRAAIAEAGYDDASLLP